MCVDDHTFQPDNTQITIGDISDADFHLIADKQLTLAAELQGDTTEADILDITTPGNFAAPTDEAIKINVSSWIDSLIS